MVEPTLISRWNTLIEDFQVQPSVFYEYLETLLKSRAIPDIRISRVNLSEGGILSATRLYLRVVRGEHTFFVCAAPFGTGTFVSSWLQHEESSGCLGAIPLFSILLQFLATRVTYYRLDTALMFQEAVHKAVLQSVDGLTKSRGTRQLSEADRKPIMRDFFTR